MLTAKVCIEDDPSRNNGHVYCSGSKFDSQIFHLFTKGIPMSSGSELIRSSAVSIVNLLKAGEVTPLDLLDALEQRIGEVDGTLNALPTLCFDRARDHARKISARPPAERGLLQGLPIPIKDLSPVAGVRSTSGSPIFADHVPEESAGLVEVIEEQDGVVYAKSNTPEFGAGASTFNEVFGRTGNPWDTTRSPAGSSGGAAAALASGMAWVAHGSDMGGSLRNPASFCGIVGLRPSPGRVPASPSSTPYDTLGQQGPMARTVEDTALLLDAMSKFHPDDPLSFASFPGEFSACVEKRIKPKRVAYSPDLGITPVDPDVARVCADAAARFQDAGVVVEEACPDFSGSEEVFQTLRALSFAIGLGPLLEKHRDLIKPDIIWNIEKGLNLSVEEILRAETERAVIRDRVVSFFDDYDLLLSPATIVPAFPIEQRFVEECNGHVFENYIQWLAVAYAVTNTSCPALSLPAGFTPSGLPVGLQMVSRPRGEGELLSAAAVLDDVLGFCSHTPIDPRTP